MLEFGAHLGTPNLEILSVVWAGVLRQASVAAAAVASVSTAVAAISAAVLVVVAATGRVPGEVGGDAPHLLPLDHGGRDVGFAALVRRVVQGARLGQVTALGEFHPGRDAAL